MLQLWDRLRREPAHRLPLTLSLSRSLSHSRPLKTLTQIESVYTYCLYYIHISFYICIFVYLYMIVGFSVPIILGNRHILTLSRCEKRLCIGGKKLPAQGSISRLLHWDK